jgi:hypothetical protein
MTHDDSAAAAAATYFAAGSDDVLTWYDMLTLVADPVPVANWMHVENGKITRIRAAFDPRGIAR